MTFSEGLTIAIGVFAISGAFYRAFSVVAELRQSNRETFLQLQAKIDLLQQKFEGVRDTHELTVNGLNERISHSVNRIKGEVQSLDAKLDDIESYLEKETSYHKRQRGG